MTCKRCGAAIKTENVAEAVEWDVSHDEVCPRITYGSNHA
ncbi:hypothetical protein C7474_2255 [Microbacterium telephonicum]|uniref:Uncharacterized protein n=1 Tax=Microbacterium telephonicum TaxID=1714841 RepID=A0A498BXI4_9MICO|nr:hypothetical protein C7474_2255 [Microbacterium telephonicum]